MKFELEKEKNKGGRPPLPKGEKRKVKSFRFNSKSIEKIEEFSKDLDMPQSRFMENLLNNCQKKKGKIYCEVEFKE